MKKLLVFLGIVVIFLGSLWLYLDQNHTTPILMYHSLDKNKVENYAAVAPDIFNKQMEIIQRSGLRVVSLSQYCRLLTAGTKLPKDLVVITFDDGYKDNLEAIKILKKFDYPATFFIIVDEIGRQEFLSRRDIAEALKNTKLEIGSHTLSHAYLPETNNEAVKKEIFESKIKLQKLFSCDISAIAYPIGGFNEQVLAEVEQTGYLCGCATNRGFSRSLNRFALRRIKVTNRDLGLRLRAKLSGFYNIFRKPKKPY